MKLNRKIKFHFLYTAPVIFKPHFRISFVLCQFAVSQPHISMSTDVFTAWESLTYTQKCACRKLISDRSEDINQRKCLHVRAGRNAILLQNFHFLEFSKLLFNKHNKSSNVCDLGTHKNSPRSRS